MKKGTRKSRVSNSTGVNKLVEDLTKSFHDSLMKAIKSVSGGKQVPRASNQPSKEPGAKKVTKQQVGYEMFLEALRKIGRPAMTKEIAARFKIIHPKASLPKTKTSLMQQLYNSASYLSKEGIIERRPVGSRSYEYSIKKEEDTAAT